MLCVFYYYEKKIGFGMIFTGIGVVIGSLIESGCICILLTVALIALGMKLFCCEV